MIMPKSKRSDYIRTKVPRSLYQEAARLGKAVGVSPIKMLAWLLKTGLAQKEAVVEEIRKDVQEKLTDGDS